MKQPLWMISVGHLLGIASIVLGLFLVITGAVQWVWLLLWPIFHFAGSLMITVGLHRYFSHGAFKTSRLWHNTMAWASVLLLNGSPFGWSTAHNAHHDHSDTPGDPHKATWDYLVWKQYKSVPMSQRRLRQLIGDPTLVFVHRYGMLLWMAIVLVLLAISWKLLLFGYLMALGSTHIIGALHQVTSHKNGTPRNLPWLEFILPACGEWNHAGHHEHAGRKDMRLAWWHVDLGYQFIRLIERKSLPKASLI